MKSRALNIALLFVGAGLFAGSAVTQAEAVAATPVAVAPVWNTVADGYSRYTLSEQYAIDFLDGSYLSFNGNDYLVITNYFPETGRCCFEPGEIKTDVYTLEASFEEVAAAISTDTGGLAGTFVREERFSINGRPAARSWWTDGDNDADSALTVVQISETEVAHINSFYSLGGEVSLETVEAIPSSFRVLE